MVDLSRLCRSHGPCGATKQIQATADLHTTNFMDDHHEPEIQPLRFFVTRFVQLQPVPLSAAQFALTGKDGPQQYKVEPLLNAFLHDRQRPTFTRDYDSVLGFTDRVPTNSDIYIRPLTASRDVLKDDLHIKVPFQIHGQVSQPITFFSGVKGLCITPYSWEIGISHKPTYRSQLGICNSR
jgi:hypothetical protein